MSNLSMFAQRLREARENKGFTQRQLAKEISVTPASLSSYEKGNSVPSLSVVKELAEACDISIDWLCGLKQENIESTKTYGDVIKYLAKAFDNYDLDLMIVTKNPRSFLIEEVEKYADIVLGLNIYGDTSEKTNYFVSLFKDWDSMRKLVKKGAIKKEVVDLWIDDKVKELSCEPIREFPF